MKFRHDSCALIKQTTKKKVTFKTPRIDLYGTRSHHLTFIKQPTIAYNATKILRLQPIFDQYTPVRKVLAERKVLRQCLGGNGSTRTILC